MTRKLIVSATLATAALMTVAGVALAADGDGRMGNGRGRGMGYGGRREHLFGGILVLGVLAVAVGLLVYFLVRRRPVAMAPAFAGAAMPPSPTASAEAILAERLARSEITPDDYRATLAALREAGGPTAPPPAG